MLRDWYSRARADGLTAVRAIVVARIMTKMEMVTPADYSHVAGVIRRADQKAFGTFRLLSDTL